MHSSSPTTIAILFFIFLFAFVRSAILNGDTERRDVPVSKAICKLPKDRGNNCADGANAGIKWYFDTESFQCLAFGYKGCAGNGNRFDSIFECRQQCRLPADYGGCSGQRPSAKNARGESISCEVGPGVESGEGEQCPEGYKCQMMAFFGICCHVETENVYNRNYRPKCANGKKPHQLFDTLNKWPVMYLGKSCEDEFCPADTECHQQEIFAHCCPK